MLNKETRAHSGTLGCIKFLNKNNLIIFKKNIFLAQDLSLKLKHYKEQFEYVASLEFIFKEQLQLNYSQLKCS
ncbi:hypothetical protein BpHYR1_039194 [Brachionus plicatilis]|uniref:Uncharacterized protein n=1 Tax=Brachionus plicatilis TaxID=10195 RepID=A0A3M7T5W9_BRAPC|nr:hypothetical protein BpHYR1_039194 [Brachionus plicatilis]